MELREAIGRRRSIRYLRPYMPVEPEKIQMMLEAARVATHWGNLQSLRAVVVHRESAPQEVLDSLKAVVVGWQLRISDSKLGPGHDRPANEVGEWKLALLTGEREGHAPVVLVLLLLVLQQPA